MEKLCVVIREGISGRNIVTVLSSTLVCTFGCHSAQTLSMCSCVCICHQLLNCVLSHLCWHGGGGVFCWQDCFLSLTVVKGLRGPLRREEARRQGVQCRAVQGPEREAVQGQEESSLISASAASLPPTPNPHPCLPCLCSSLLLSAGD